MGHACARRWCAHQVAHAESLREKSFRNHKALPLSAPRTALFYPMCAMRHAVPLCCRYVSCYLVRVWCYFGSRVLPHPVLTYTTRGSDIAYGATQAREIFRILRVDQLSKDLKKAAAELLDAKADR
eukprot:484665-Rhodomonas_salina.2